MNEITIFVASETGKANELALQFSRACLRRNIRGRVRSVSELAFDEAELCVFFISTTGNGDVPNSMRHVYSKLLHKEIKKTNLKFAIFGLGDSVYEKFNAAARKFRSLLLKTGSLEVVKIGLGDDCSSLGVDQDFIIWSNSFWPIVLSSPQFRLPADFVINEGPLLQAPSATVFFGAGFVAEYEKEKEMLGKYAEYVRLMDSKDNLVDFEREDCFEAKVEKNEKITEPNDQNDDKLNNQMNKDVRLIELSSDEVDYSAGDVLSIFPENTSAQVEAFIEHFRLNPDLLIHIPASKLGPCTLKPLLTSYYDLTQPLTKSKLEFLYFFSFSQNPEEKPKILEMLQPQNADLYQSYILKEHRSLLDMAMDFDFRIPLTFLLADLLEPIRCRDYSICSSPKFHSQNVIQIVVSCVRFLTPTQRLYRGKTSEFVKALEVDSKLKVRVKQGTLRISKEVSPLVLIGPGTGVAPLRSILYEHIDKGKEIYLFFGCRRVDEDFLFKKEFMDLAEKYMNLHLCVAFSRQRTGYSSNMYSSSKSQTLPKRVLEKQEGSSLKSVYVQQALKAHGPEIYDLIINRSATIFICGSSKVPPKVHTSLVSLLSSLGNKTENEAETYIAVMQRYGRYFVEAW